MPVYRLFLCSLLFALTTPVAASDTVTIPPLQCGDDEREFGAGACPQETKFTAGTVSTAPHLKVGGEAAGCDSEWATSLEFALDAVPAQQPVVSAVLTVRKTGYSDDSEGFPYVGVFAYPATGAPVTVGRDDLNPDTMLDVVFPSSANVDLSFDVTAAVQGLVASSAPRAGFLLAGAYSEVGYEDWISVGGATYAIPPRLVVIYEGTVPTSAGRWSSVKAAYR